LRHIEWDEDKHKRLQTLLDRSEETDNMNSAKEIPPHLRHIKWDENKRKNVQTLVDRIEETDNINLANERRLQKIIDHGDLEKMLKTWKKKVTHAHSLLEHGLGGRRVLTVKELIELRDDVTAADPLRYNAEQILKRADNEPNPELREQLRHRLTTCTRPCWME
jgi:uncharacterized membrane-anchored protein YjiN (DUF445 family)